MPTSEFSVPVSIREIMIWAGAIDESHLIGISEELKKAEGDPHDRVLFLTSEGGDISVAWAFFTLAQATRARLHIVAVGNVESAAVTVFLASEYRYATPMARFLIHDIAQQDDKVYGREASRRIQESEQKSYIDLLARHLSIGREEIEEMSHKTSVIDADEALRIGLVKYIVDPRTLRQ